jgi:hypothetical protein
MKRKSDATLENATDEQHGAKKTAAPSLDFLQAKWNANAKWSVILSLCRYRQIHTIVVIIVVIAIVIIAVIIAPLSHEGMANRCKCGLCLDTK